MTSQERYRKREIILKLWSQNHSSVAIGLQVGKSDQAVRQIVVRARHDGDARAKYRSKGLIRLHHLIGRPRTYKSSPGRIPPNLRPRIMHEAELRGTDAAGLIEAVLVKAFENEWFLKVVLGEDG